MAANFPKDRPTRILNAASRLIVHYGFDKTTMEDIAREAGVSKGSLYLVWSSKDQLFEALLGHEMRRLLLDLRSRIEQDPNGGQIANQYQHTLLALQNNPLICALYTCDSRVLGDFVRRQDVSRYTDRLLLGRDSVKQMQAAGLLRDDLRPEAITYLFSMIALGFMNVGTIVPESEAPPLAETAAAVSALVERGLGGPGGDSTAGKEATIKMIDFMLEQWEAK